MTISQTELAHFHGTMQYHKSNMFTGTRLLHTDGVQYVAENGGAYWLLDLIASHYNSVARWVVNCGGFATITLRKNKTGSGARVRVGDGNGMEKTLQMIPFTDFPFDDLGTNEFKMFIQNDGSRLILMLPSEY
jgi:hypothetical protein